MQYNHEYTLESLPRNNNNPDDNFESEEVKEVLICAKEEKRSFTKLNTEKLKIMADGETVGSADGESS